jgi:four helix bundle protein
VVSNIAEGCGRQSERELSYFLRIARGSVREVECQLLLSRDLGYLSREVWDVMDAAAQEISKMLNAFASTVRSSGRTPAPSPPRPPAPSSSS